tara:strand:- start:279 stop:2066 length:1788 start_codon:yes stop_codon:yes gene_type:complete
VNDLTNNHYKESHNKFISLFKIWKYIGKKRKIQILLLGNFMLLSGFAEMFSLASVIPFISILTNPEKISEIRFFGSLITLLPFISNINLPLFATLTFCLCAVFAGFIRIINLWLSNQLAAAIGGDLSCKVYKKVLSRNFYDHLKRNTSEVIDVASTQIILSVTVLNFSLLMMTSFVITIFLISTLLIINWKITIILVLTFFVMYLLLAFTARRKLALNGKKITTASEKQVQLIQEGMGSIRDVILDKLQNHYLENYSVNDDVLRSRIANNQFLASYPRFLLESIGLLLIALVGYFASLNSTDSSQAITTLGLFAIGAQRLLPSMQSTYKNWATVKSRIASINKVVSVLDEPLTVFEKLDSQKNLGFKNSVKFDSISFKYPNSYDNSLEELDLEIYKGECIGIVGKTGSGKSTFMDMLMGLLPPDKGEITVDGINIFNMEDSCIKEWHKKIAHVPQDIFISNNTFLENIAFGENINSIDMHRVRKAAEKACISDYIESLKYNYKTELGERGVRLSGGQKQRIAIARALYKCKEILCLDEATSSLDVPTEKLLMNRLKDEKDKQFTMIMIAHRLSTLSMCDRIIEFSNGKVKSIKSN